MSKELGVDPDAPIKEVEVPRKRKRQRKRRKRTTAKMRRAKRREVRRKSFESALLLNKRACFNNYQCQKSISPCSNFLILRIRSNLDLFQVFVILACDKPMTDCRPSPICDEDKL